MDLLSLTYKLSLIIGAIANLVMAVFLLAGQRAYTRYPIYSRARLFTVLWLVVFAAGYLVHAFLEIRTFWPTGAAALTISYFHLGAICFCWGYMPLLNPDYPTRRIRIRDTIIYVVGLVGYWTTALIWKETSLFTMLPYLVFFVYCAWHTVLFYKTFNRVTKRLVSLSYGNVSGFVRWMQACCDLIIFFGIFCVAITALLPHSIRFITPFETLLGIGIFGYIVYCINRYGKVVEEATRATENVAEIGKFE